MPKALQYYDVPKLTGVYMFRWMVESIKIQLQII